MVDTEQHFIDKKMVDGFILFWFLLLDSCAESNLWKCYLVFIHEDDNDDDDGDVHHHHHHRHGSW